MMIRVCNRSETGFKFTVADGRDIILRGKNLTTPSPNNVILPYRQRYTLTLVDHKDWEEIKVKYKHMYEMKRGIVFAEQSDVKTLDRADDEESDSVATGVNGLTVKDLTPGTKVQNVNPNLNPEANAANELQSRVDEQEQKAKLKNK